MSIGQEHGANQNGVAVAEVSKEVKKLIEALIFASDEPLSDRLLRTVIDEVNKDVTDAERVVVTDDQIRKAVDVLNEEYESVGGAFHIIRLAGGFTYATKPQYARYVGKLVKEKARRKLSTTAIETLAIIAYKQPITKSEVEFIRGVNADYIMKTLLEKGLVTITGRAHSPGRPLLYGTTAEFLKHFGLNEISDLPKPREIEELIGETELEVDRRLLAEQQELEFKDELAQKLEQSEGETSARGKGTSMPKKPKAEILAEIIISEKEKPAPAEQNSAERAPIPVEEPAGQVTQSVEEVLPENFTDEVHRSPGEPLSISPIDGPAEKYKEATTPQPAVSVAEAQPMKGWSKWKTRVKEFFQKLFA